MCTVYFNEPFGRGSLLPKPSCSHVAKSEHSAVLPTTQLRCMVSARFPVTKTSHSVQYCAQPYTPLPKEGPNKLRLAGCMAGGGFGRHESRLRQPLKTAQTPSAKSQTCTDTASTTILLRLCRSSMPVCPVNKAATTA